MVVGGRGGDTDERGYYRFNLSSVFTGAGRPGQFSWRQRQFVIHMPLPDSVLLWSTLDDRLIKPWIPVLSLTHFDFRNFCYGIYFCCTVCGYALKLTLIADLYTWFVTQGKQILELPILHSNSTGAFSRQSAFCLWSAKKKASALLRCRPHLLRGNDEQRNFWLQKTLELVNTAALNQYIAWFFDLHKKCESI